MSNQAFGKGFRKFIKPISPVSEGAYSALIAIMHTKSEHTLLTALSGVSLFRQVSHVHFDLIELPLLWLSLAETLFASGPPTQTLFC